jgi:mannose-6-phosphate isomerase-like protein (cupin superfamily)
MLETITLQGQMFAVVIRADYSAPGITFFTPPNFSQQLAYMNHPKGKIIEPHIHNPVSREVRYTQEVLFIRKGRLRVDFYSENRNYLESRELGAGDLILLASGGHGFEVLEEIEMIEVKQGPYAGDADKTRFSGVEVSQIKLLGK